jgi:hypothetical protein
MIKTIAKRHLLVGDQILNYPGEKTPMVVVAKRIRPSGYIGIDIRRLHGRKIYGSALPDDHEFQVER